MFDLFETLYPWGPDKYSRALDALCARLSELCPGHSPQDVRERYIRIWKDYSDRNITQLMENDFPQTISDLIEASGAVPTEETKRRAIESYESGLAGALEAPPGVSGMVKRLAGSFKIGVLSNYPTSGGIRLALERDGILGHADALIVSSEIGYIKPHQAMFQEVCKKLDCRPERVLLVGDTWESDIVGAYLYGMPSLLIEPSHAAVEQGKSFNGYIRQWLESQPNDRWRLARPLATLSHVVEVEKWLGASQQN